MDDVSKPTKFDYNNALIGDYLTEFAETKLTSAEERTFERLKNSLLRLNQVETATFAGDGSGTELADALAIVRNQLDDLAAIQMEEGRRKLQLSKKALGSVELFTQFEIGALVVMAILIQILILYTPNIKIDE